MKIILLNWRDISNPLAGGAEIHMHEFARRWVATGNSVTQISSRFKGGSKREIIDGVEIVRIGNEYTTYLGAMRFLAANRGNKSISVVFEGINTVPYFSPLFTEAPVVAQIYSLDNSLALLRETTVSMLPVVVAAFSASRMIPWTYRDSWIITNTNSSRQRLARSGFDRAKIFAVNPGISEEFRRELQNFTNLARPNSTIVYLGRLKKYKDVQNLISAMDYLRREIPDAKLLVLGRGDYEERLKATVAGLGLQKHVEFCGHVSEREKAELLTSSSLYVCTSVDEGGWTIAAIEAMAAGVPAAVSSTQIDVLDGGRNGILLNSTKPADVAASILEILGDRVKWSRLSNSAKSFSAGINWDDSAKRALEVLEVAVNESRKPRARSVLRSVFSNLAQAT